MSNKESLDQKKRWAIVSIASIPLVMTLGNSMLIPVLPLLEKKLRITSFQSSLIITVYSVVAILFIPLAGYLSDKIGRKNVIIPSLILASIGGLISAIASWKIPDAYWLILVGRTLQGIGASGAFPIVLPLVGDLFQSEEEVSTSLGIIETGNTLGKVLSPILGAFLGNISWYLPFFSIPVFCLISILLISFLVKGPKKQEAPSFKTFIKNVAFTFKINNRWLNSVFFIGGVLMFILFAVLFFLSTILETRFKIGEVTKGVILAIPLSVLCLCSYLAGKKIKNSKKTMKWTSFIGICLFSISLLILRQSWPLWVLIGLFSISAAGIGLTLPCLDALITQGIDKDKRGTISSLYSSMRFIGVALGPPAVALLMKSMEKNIFFILFLLGILACFVCLFWIRPESEHDPAPEEGTIFIRYK